MQPMYLVRYIRMTGPLKVPYSSQTIVSCTTVRSGMLI